MEMQKVYRVFASKKLGVVLAVVSAGIALCVISSLYSLMPYLGMETYGGQGYGENQWYKLIALPVILVGYGAFYPILLFADIRFGYRPGFKYGNPKFNPMTVFFWFGLALIFGILFMGLQAIGNGSPPYLEDMIRVLWDLLRMWFVAIPLGIFLNWLSFINSPTRWILN
jgi:hypothetical protein